MSTTTKSSGLHRPLLDRPEAGEALLQRGQLGLDLLLGDLRTRFGTLSPLYSPSTGVGRTCTLALKLYGCVDADLLQVQLGHGHGVHVGSCSAASYHSGRKSSSVWLST